jgi:hypothetical protein
LRKLIAYISISCIAVLSSSFTALPGIGKEHLTAIIPVIMDKGKEIAEKASLLYDRLNLRNLGLSPEAFNYAYRGYEYLLDKNLVNDSAYLTICDFTQSSKQKRLYLIDMLDNKILLNTYVAHGHNSGGEYATRFSNRLRSKQSSLGFYVTQNTYVGEHGLSLRMEGLEPGFNDKAYRRAIVLHGASYIGNGSTGRSYGCPAVPKNESKQIINTIKNGTCLFIYHPDKKYLQGSKILND